MRVCGWWVAGWWVAGGEGGEGVVHCLFFVRWARAPILCGLLLPMHGMCWLTLRLLRVVLRGCIVAVRTS